MSRRRPTILDRAMQQWRRIRRHELTRTIRHMQYQEKRAAYLRAYVKRSLESLNRTEGKIQGHEEKYID